jgi:hypothetical protein
MDNRPRVFVEKALATHGGYLTAGSDYSCKCKHHLGILRPEAPRLNFSMRCIAAQFDRRWDDGTRSRPNNDNFGGTVSNSWGMGLEFSSKIRVPAAGGGGFFSSFSRNHWDHACTSWAGDRGMSTLFTFDRDPEPEPAPTLRLVPRPPRG